MWLATSIPPMMEDPCFDFRGVPPGDRCTFVDFSRELLPIFSASTIEVGVADARAEEQRREGIGPEGDNICLRKHKAKMQRQLKKICDLDFNSDNKFEEDWGDRIEEAV
jgi:hypothetical protein